MTICDYPAREDERALRELWQEAFGDTEDFLDAFFETGFSPDRCRCIRENSAVKSALYFFDCSLNGQKYAYLYAVATERGSRGRGLCRALMADTHALLKNEDYAGTILVPGEKSLFRFYEKLGYRTVTTVTETACARPAGEAARLHPLTAREYGALRREFLPQGGVVQEGASLDFLSRYARFARGDDFLLAYSAEGGKLSCHELLGKGDMGRILTALSCTEGTFRTPGAGKDFSMFLPLQDTGPVPAYFGLAMD